jgi:hypothetical protein
VLRVADRLGVDLVEAVRRKTALNGETYPVDCMRGRADRYAAF